MNLRRAVVLLNGHQRKSHKNQMNGPQSEPHKLHFERFFICQTNHQDAAHKLKFIEVIIILLRNFLLISKLNTFFHSGKK